MAIRNEKETDIPGMEHFIINALRSAGALTVSLLAEIEDKIDGYGIFSVICKYVNRNKSFISGGRLDTEKTLGPG